MARMQKEDSPSIAEADAASIDAFLERAWSEDGLADRTLEAYRRDLEALARWLAGRGRSLGDARREDISAYHGAQHAAVRSMARRRSGLPTPSPSSESRRPSMPIRRLPSCTRPRAGAEASRDLESGGET